MSLHNEILNSYSSIHEDVVLWRRHLHQNAELSGEEFYTSDYIANTLESMEYTVCRGIGGHGLIAILEGELGGTDCVAIRADMDALPILEENTHGFVSLNKGVMHACGHDYHSASLLGAAALLQKLKSQISGSIKLIFQPSEEKMPGGASLMIKEGVLLNPKVKAIIAQHVSPELPTGTVGLHKGTFMASADEIYITLRGKGGHAAFPHEINDPVLCAAHIIQALQSVISRHKNPFDHAVLSIGKVIADGATNIIPDTVRLEGTFRAMNENYRLEAHRAIKEIAENIAASFGVETTVNIVVGYPCLYNDPAITDVVKQCADSLQKDAIEVNKRMGAEDFSYYSQEIPACLIRIGTGSAADTQHGLHTSRFDVDEEAFRTSVPLLTHTAISLLK